MGPGERHAVAAAHGGSQASPTWTQRPRGGATRGRTRYSRCIAHPRTSKKLRLRYLIPALLIVCVATGGGITAHAAGDRQTAFTDAAGAAVAELAGPAASPGPGMPAAVEGQAVAGAGGDGAEGDPGGHGHRHRRAASGGGAAVAELAVEVVSPGPGMPAAVEGQAVLAVGGDGAEGDPGGHAHRHRRAAGGGAAVAELAEVALSPGPGVA